MLRKRRSGDGKREQRGLLAQPQCPARRCHGTELLALGRVQDSPKPQRIGVSSQRQEGSGYERALHRRCHVEDGEASDRRYEEVAFAQAALGSANLIYVAEVPVGSPSNPACACVQSAWSYYQRAFWWRSSGSDHCGDLAEGNSTPVDRPFEGIRENPPQIPSALDAKINGGCAAHVNPPPSTIRREATPPPVQRLQKRVETPNHQRAER